MDYVKIGGRVYYVTILDIEETFTILYTDKTGRTIGVGAPMMLDPLGTYFSHKITFKMKNDNVRDYDALYNFVAIPRYDGFDVEIVHDQTTIKYKAYISKGGRKLKKIVKSDNKVLWDSMTVTFTPMEAQVIPV